MIEVVSKYAKVSCFGWQTKKRNTLVRKQRKASQQEQEQLLSYYERTDKDLQSQRFPGQEDFKQEEKRMGRGMWEHDLVSKITALNPDLFAEDSVYYKGCAAFYWKRANEKVYTAANWKKGWLPEWTILETDAADLPTREGYRPGWRQIVQRLVQIGALKRSQAEKAFGFVTLSDLRSRNWHTAIGKFTD